MALVVDTPVLAQWCARCPDVTLSISSHPHISSLASLTRFSSLIAIVERLRVFVCHKTWKRVLNCYVGPTLSACKFALFNLVIH